MDDQIATLSAIVPVILLLTLGVVAAVSSRTAGLTSIVEYLLLGLALSASGMRVMSDNATNALLTALGVVFMLFDFGLHFSLARTQAQARDIFGFGAAQVLSAAVALAAARLALAPERLSPDATAPGPPPSAFACETRRRDARDRGGRQRRSHPPHARAHAQRRQRSRQPPLAPTSRSF